MIEITERPGKSGALFQHGVDVTEAIVRDTLAPRKRGDRERRAQGRRATSRLPGCGAGDGQAGRRSGRAAERAERRRFPAVLHLELGKNGPDVPLDGTVAEEKLLGDFPVGLVLGKELEDLALPGR